MVKNSSPPRSKNLIKLQHYFRSMLNMVLFEMVWVGLEQPNGLLEAPCIIHVCTDSQIEAREHLLIIEIRTRVT